MKSIESSKTIDPDQKSMDSIDSIDFVDWIPKLFTFNISGVLFIASFSLLAE